MKLRFVFCLMQALSSLIFFSLPVFAKETPLVADLLYINKIKAQRDQLFPKKVKNFKLKNGLEVLIIESSLAQQTSVSMSVGTGFLEDPPEHRGLSHYLEHMLFLGTKKYPQGGEYFNFIAHHGGYSNAFTSLDETHYVFQIRNTAFDEALDRFAHFFIDPTFEESQIPKELQNIESEYRKNENDPNFQDFHLKNILSNPDHPRSRAFQGNLDTLKNVTRSVFIRHYYQHYSANNMKLVITSSLPIGHIENQVKNLFEQVPVFFQYFPVSVIRNSPNVIRPNDIPRIVLMKPTTKRANLSIAFEIPSRVEYLYSNPQYFIRTDFMRKDAGSLHAILKSRGLITNIIVANDDNKNYSNFEIYFELTDLGEKNWKEICLEFFKYVAFLKRVGLKNEVFLEHQKVMELRYLTSAVTYTEASVRNYSTQLRNISATEIEIFENLLVRWDPNSYQYILKFMTPRRAQIFLTVQGLDSPRYEKLYGIEYQTNRPEEIDLYAWGSAQPNPEMHPSLPNSFIPENIPVVQPSQKQEIPQLVKSDSRMKIWLQTDPVTIGVLKLQIKTQPNLTPQNYIMEQLYLFLMQNRLADKISASQVGYRFGFSRAQLGYELEFYGYSDKLVVYAKDIISELRKISVSEIEFEKLKEGWIRQIENLKYEKPFVIASNILAAIENPRYVHLSAEQVISQVKSISLQEIQTYAQSFLNKSFILGYGAGNINLSTIEAITNEIIQQFNIEALESEKHPVYESIQYLEGKPIYSNQEVAGTDHAWLQSYQLVGSPLQVQVAAAIAENILSADFRDVIRRQNTLGYMVQAAFIPGLLTSEMQFLVQSNYTFEQISTLVHKWVQTIPEKISQVPGDRFLQIKQNICDTWKSRQDTFEEKYSHFASSVFYYGADWNWNKKALDALMNMTQQEVVQIFENTINPKQCRKVTIQCIGENAVSCSAVRDQEMEIEDLSFLQKQSN